MTIAQTFELPIFPLQAVLFPGGVLPLKIFEQRYMDMAKECLKSDRPFGVCLIAEGAEVGAPATPQAVGSSARITEWDMPQLGVLQVVARGGQRFRIHDRSADRHGLIRAQVEWIAADAPLAVPAALQGLVPLLQAVVSEVGKQRMPEPHDFGDAAWVGYRYCEILPIPLLARQKLLELADPLSRLRIIFEFLRSHGLADAS